MKKGIVNIIIQRDSKNMPFAKVLYNGQDAFNLDNDMKLFAEYLARKSAIANNDEGLIFVSTETGEILEANQINRLMDMGYCISGSESGIKFTNELISTISCGASNLDIMAPVYVTDGKVQPIFINEDSVSKEFQNLDIDTKRRLCDEKYYLLYDLIEGQNEVSKKRI